MKTCRKCGAEKPLEDFPVEKRRPDGRESQCRECVRARARANYAKRMTDAEYKAAQKERWDAYRANNSERINGAQKRYRERNRDWLRERNREVAREFRKANPDYWRLWYAKNIERERERARLSMEAHRREHPEREVERKQRYFERNPEKVRAQWRENTHRRRALKGGTSGELAALMAEMVTQPCVYCGSTDRVTIDHVVPLSRGGKHEADNLAPACLPCNCSKGNKLLSEWAGRTS